jgi:hypothetical protein
VPDGLVNMLPTLLVCRKANYFSVGKKIMLTVRLAISKDAHHDLICMRKNGWKGKIL